MWQTDKLTVVATNQLSFYGSIELRVKLLQIEIDRTMIYVHIATSGCGKDY